MTGVDEIDALVVEEGSAERVVLHRIVAAEDDVARSCFIPARSRTRDSCTPVHWAMQLQPSTQSCNVAGDVVGVTGALRANSGPRLHRDEELIRSLRRGPRPADQTDRPIPVAARWRAVRNDRRLAAPNYRRSGPINLNIA